jgi:hypothetical protein
LAIILLPEQSRARDLNLPQAIGRRQNRTALYRRADVASWQLSLLVIDSAFHHHDGEQQEARNFAIRD